ncbi:MAG: PhnD/SsuA/transferrin family substrate-binding protein [Rhodobacterales bacterium]
MTTPQPTNGRDKAARISRRVLLGGAASMAIPGLVRASEVLRLGITPVFLDNDAAILSALQSALSISLGRDVSFQQRRTYEEVTGLLLEGSVDAAWLCGYPYLQHQERLQLLAVPLWNGQPRYQSYLIVHEGDTAEGLPDLRGGVHAFSDPDSNSGFLVTASDLAEMGERPDDFFARTIFTFGHRNVVRAVSDGLVRSGSVDGYVWESLAVVEPALVARTRIVSRSEWLGFPPFCARRGDSISSEASALTEALTGLDQTETGRIALRALLLDGMTRGSPELFDGIARRMRILAALR